MNKILKTRNYLQQIKKFCEMSPEKKVDVIWNGNNKCEINYEEICQLIHEFDTKYKLNENFN